MWVIYSADSGMELDSIEHRGEAELRIRELGREREHERITMRWDNR